MRHARSAIGITIVMVCALSAPLGAQGADQASASDPAPVGAQSADVDAPSIDLPEVSRIALARAAALQLDQVIQQPAGPPPTPRHTGIRVLLKDLGSDVTHLRSKENLFWAAIGGILAASVHPIDDNVNRTMVSSTLAENIFKPGRVFGQFGTLFGAAGITYAVGRMRDQPKVSHMGMDLVQAIAVSEAMTQAIKYSVRRMRPDGSSRTSFPSGHAADTFAFATALERHVGWRMAVPAYMFSSYVALSRMPANRHWFSDVIFGASVGIIAGRTVTRHREYPVFVAAVPGGAAVFYSRSR